MNIFDIIVESGLRLRIGDPTFLGWATTSAYLVAAALCFACAWQAERIFTNQDAKPHKAMWGVLGFGLLFFGVNKQLDLQTWMITVARAIAYEQGWYDHRQAIQVGFVVGMIVAALAVFIGGAWVLRSNWRNYGLLFVGLILLARFMIVRVASIYGVPLPRLSRLAGGLQINWLLELTSLAIIISVTLHFLYQFPKSPQNCTQRNVRR